MAMLTVRNLPDEVHRALHALATSHNRSMEAEVREILKAWVKPKGRIKLGSLLAHIGQQIELSDEEFTVIEQVRDKTSAKTVSFE